MKYAIDEHLRPPPHFFYGDLLREWDKGKANPCTSTYQSRGSASGT